MSEPVRQFAFVTTCSREGWTEYGKRFAESFLAHFPADARLYFYVDFKAPLEDERIVFRSIPALCPELITFQDGLGRFDFARGDSVAQSGHEQSHHAHILWNARKFSFKVFCVEHAVLSALEQVVIWIDADTVAFANIPEELIADNTPEWSMVSYLGRAWKYTECGYVGYNLQHPLTAMFVRAVADMYRTGAIFSLNEWHDSYVWDTVRIAFERTYGVRNHNISSSVADLDHVFVNSALGRYLDHMKGGRKEKGRSRTTDVKTHSDLAYWSGRAVPAPRENGPTA